MMGAKMSSPHPAPTVSLTILPEPAGLMLPALALALLLSRRRR